MTIPLIISIDDSRLLNGQRSHFYLVEIQNGTFLDHETENIQMGSEQIERQGLGTGNLQVKIGEL